jgi:hypothetical protein
MYSEMAEMMDPEDLEYLRKNASRGKAFQIDTEKTVVDQVEENPENESGESDDDDDGDEGFDEFETKAVKRIKV